MTNHLDEWSKGDKELGVGYYAGMGWQSNPWMPSAPVQPPSAPDRLQVLRARIRDAQRTLEMSDRASPQRRIELDEAVSAAWEEYDAEVARRASADLSHEQRLVRFALDAKALNLSPWVDSGNWNRLNTLAPGMTDNQAIVVRRALGQEAKP